MALTDLIFPVLAFCGACGALMFCLVLWFGTGWLGKPETQERYLYAALMCYGVAFVLGAWLIGTQVITVQAFQEGLKENAVVIAKTDLPKYCPELSRLFGQVNPNLGNFCAINGNSTYGAVFCNLTSQNVPGSLMPIPRPQG